VCFLVRLVPNSSRYLSRKKRKGMSSSDSVSLSTSSSESIESGRVEVDKLKKRAPVPEVW